MSSVARLKRLWLRYFEGKDSSIVLFEEWSLHKDADLEYGRGDSWDQMLRQGIQLLERLAQDNRIVVADPKKDLQIKVLRSLSNGNDFVSYIDGVGTLNGKRTSARMEDHDRSISGRARRTFGTRSAGHLLQLDDRYSPMFRSSPSFVNEYRRFSTSKRPSRNSNARNLASWFKNTVSQIEAGQFHSHPGIRFPSNGCVSCSQLGLCLDNPQLVEAKLIRRPGAS